MKVASQSRLAAARLAVLFAAINLAIGAYRLGFGDVCSADGAGHHARRVVGRRPGRLAMTCQGAADEMHDQPQPEENSDDTYQLSHEQVRDTRGFIGEG